MLGKVKVAASKEFISFFLFNCILPTTDMSTDFVTYLDLRLDHPKWAVLTLSWMFFPFLLRFVQFLYKGRQEKCSVEMFLNVLKHFPFLLPMENLRKLVVMIKKEHRIYRRDVAAKKYSFLSDVGDASLYESFCESGPQEHSHVKLIISIKGRVQIEKKLSFLIFRRPLHPCDH